MLKDITWRRFPEVIFSQFFEPRIEIIESKMFLLSVNFTNNAVLHPPVPLGSIPELPADSCGEIKTSEGTQTVSGNYWLDPLRSGIPLVARCDMTTEG